MDVDVVIVNWNGGPELVDAVRSIGPFGGRPILVDNGSTIVRALSEAIELPRVTILRMGRNVGFASAANAGVAAGSSPIVLLLNPDAEIISGTSADLVKAFEPSEIKLLGVSLVGTDGRPLPVLRRLPKGRDLVADVLRLRALVDRVRRTARRTPSERVADLPDGSVGWLVGSALAMRRTDWDALAGLDSGYFLWYEDVDLAARSARAGGTAAVAREVVVRHMGAVSWKRLSQRARQRRRVASAFRYARRNLGPPAAIGVALAAPFALTIGVGLDVAHALRQQFSGAAAGGRTSRRDEPDG